MVSGDSGCVHLPNILSGCCGCLVEVVSTGGDLCRGCMLRDEPLLPWNGRVWRRCGMGASGMLNTISAFRAAPFCIEVLALQSPCQWNIRMLSIVGNRYLHLQRYTDLLTSAFAHNKSGPLGK